MSNVVVAKLIPILAAFCVLKAALDVAEGQSPLANLYYRIIMLSINDSMLTLN